MDNIKIIETSLKYIFDPKMIEIILAGGYNKTGLKFRFEVAGSKGYANHIEINCECTESNFNRILFSDIWTVQRKFKKKNVFIYYTKKYGVVVTTSKSVLKELNII